MPYHFNEATEIRKRLMDMRDENKPTSDWRGYTEREKIAIKKYQIARAIVKAKQLKIWQHDPIHDTWMP